MHAPRRTIGGARELRSAMSLPEVLLWRELRRGQLDGLRFRRQHPFGRYVLDFYCAEARLAVKIDGISHAMGDRPRTDAIRDEWLHAQGVRVLRLPTREVLDNLEGVVLTIAEASRP